MNSKETKVHILIIPPEEFIPPNAPLSGIFQFDQASMLVRHGIKTGVISVSKPIALLPAITSFVRRLIGKKVFYKVLEGKSSLQILRLIINELSLKVSFKYELVNGIDVMRIQCRCWNDSGAKGELRYFNQCIQNAYVVYKKKIGIPHLIHAHNAWLAGTGAMEISKLWNIPYGITEHSTFYARNLIPHSHYKHLQRCYSLSQFNLVVSRSLGELLNKQNLLTNNYVELPNVLDPIFENTRPLLKNDIEDFIFLTVGELTHKKAQDVLLYSFSKKFKGNKNVRLIIGGSGDMDTVLKRIAHEEGISSQVTFTGSLTRLQVLEQMQNCSVFVLPSLVETFGVVLIEAMAMGKPVIATRSGGPETFVNDDNGLLIGPGSIDELSIAMELIYRKEKEFDAIFIRQNVLKHFGSEKIASTLIQIYNHAIASGND